MEFFYLQGKLKFLKKIEKQIWKKISNNKNLKYYMAHLTC